jgi:hypothetical protein
MAVAKSIDNTEIKIPDCGAAGVGDSVGAGDL